MISGSYRELFSIITQIAAALTGLLFVAISLAPTRDAASGENLVQQWRAAAAYLAFINALFVSMFALVPGTNVGYPAIVLGVIGLFFTAAAVRSLLAKKLAARLQISQISLLAALLATLGFEIDSGISLLTHPHDVAALQTVAYLLLTSLVIGVARSWELVGQQRQTGLISSIALLWGREHREP